MAKSDWWFKFEHLKWLTDEQLGRCSLETQGFWMRCLCVMRKSGSAKIEGTQAELCRLLSVTPAEFKKCFSEISHTKTANVTQTANFFTLMSRKFLKELKVKQQNALRKRKQRSHAPVTVVSQDRVKSNKKEVIKEEEREAVAEAAPEPTNVDQRKGHPAILGIWQATGIYPPKEIWDELINRLGSEIDSVLLKKCYTAWRVRGYNKVNYDWTEWYHEGIPKQGKQNGSNTRNGSGFSTRPTPGEIIANRPYR